MSSSAPAAGVDAPAVGDPGLRRGGRRRAGRVRGHPVVALCHRPGRSRPRRRGRRPRGVRDRPRRDAHPWPARSRVSTCSCTRRIGRRHRRGTAREGVRLHRHRHRADGVEARRCPRARHGPRDRRAACDLEPLAFASAIAEAGGAPDVVIDLVGGAYVTAEVAAVAPRGRIVIVGTLAGGMPAVPLLGLMQKRAEMHGTVLRPRSIADKAAATAAFVAEVVPMLADGRARPIVDRVFPLDERRGRLRAGRGRHHLRQGHPRRRRLKACVTSRR